MKKRLVILSDLWGLQQTDWLEEYVYKLSSCYEIQIYDSCDLADVDKTECTQNNLHSQFISGGIDRAVQSLLDLELDNVSILAFSVGGVIAWKYGIVSGKVDSLYCVSSTRLRHEFSKPDCRISLYYGDRDNFRPDKKWFINLALEENLVEGKDHYLYRDADFAKSMVKKIIE